jgi:hypothetical protein
LLGSFTISFSGGVVLEYDKQDQQGKATFNERNPTRPSKKNQWQGAQKDPKQKQNRAQAEHGQANLQNNT